MSEGNSGRQLAGVVRWLVLALVPTVAFAALVSLGPPGMIGVRPAAALEPTLLAVGRLVGLMLCGWLLASQCLYTLAVITRTQWLVEVLRPITLPLVRRAVAGLATVSISFSAVTALAQGPTDSTVVVVDYGNLRQEATPTPNLQPLVEVQTEEACVGEEPIGSYSAPLTWLVQPGDHLWKIAGEHLNIVLDRLPTREEHARYWVEVIKAAQPVIRSGDPNLIYPGEQIPLPPTLDAGLRP